MLHVMANQMARPLRSEPFSIHIDEAVLADLRDRVRKTRWPHQIPGIGWQQGADLDY
jgi:microsomal epoxide hydrolase